MPHPSKLNLSCIPQPAVQCCANSHCLQDGAKPQSATKRNRGESTTSFALERKSLRPNQSVRVVSGAEQGWGVWAGVGGRARVGARAGVGADAGAGLVYADGTAVVGWLPCTYGDCEACSVLIFGQQALQISRAPHAQGAVASPGSNNGSISGTAIDPLPPWDSHYSLLYNYNACGQDVHFSGVPGKSSVNVRSCHFFIRSEGEYREIQNNRMDKSHDCHILLPFKINHLLCMHASCQTWASKPLCLSCSSIWRSIRGGVILLKSGNEQGGTKTHWGGKTQWGS